MIKYKNVKKKLCVKTQYTLFIKRESERERGSLRVVRNTVYQVNGQMTDTINYSLVLIAAVTFHQATRFPFNAKQLLSKRSDASELSSGWPVPDETQTPVTLLHLKQNGTRASGVMLGYVPRLCLLSHRHKVYQCWTWSEALFCYTVDTFTLACSQTFERELHTAGSPQEGVGTGWSSRSLLQIYWKHTQVCVHKELLLHFLVMSWM